MAVHLMKELLLASVTVYSCDVWHISASDSHKIVIGLNNSIRKKFNACFGSFVLLNYFTGVISY